MEHCPKCNAEVKDNYLFCEACGADLRTPIINEPKTSVAKKVEKKEMEDLKKLIKDSKKEFKRELASIKERNSEFKKRPKVLEEENDIKQPEILSQLNKKLSKFERKEEVNKKINLLEKQIKDLREELQDYSTILEGIKKPKIAEGINKKIDFLEKQIEEFIINFNEKLNQLKKGNKEEIQIVNQKEEKLEEKERKEEQKVSNIFKSIITRIDQQFEGIKKKSEEKPKKKRKIKPIPWKKAKKSEKKRLWKKIHRKIKSIGQLRKPNITKQKMSIRKPKFSVMRRTKNIKQLHIPRIVRSL